MTLNETLFPYKTLVRSDRELALQIKAGQRRPHPRIMMARRLEVGFRRRREQRIGARGEIVEDARGLRLGPDRLDRQRHRTGSPQTAARASRNARKHTRLHSSHYCETRLPSSA